MFEDLLTTEEACKLMGIGKSTLYVWASLGRVERRKLGRLTRWSRRNLELFVQNSTLAAKRKRRVRG